MTDRPTEEAQRFFSKAQHWFNTGKAAGFKDQPQIGNIIAGLSEMTVGLDQLARGLRATYVLLEQVNRKLDQQGPARKF